MKGFVCALLWQSSAPSAAVARDTFDALEQLPMECSDILPE
jgi:hypothetical protein